MNDEFDEEGLKEAIRRHWKYHLLSNRVYWTCQPWFHDTMKIEVAPVKQEYFGGMRDGESAWSGFEMNLTDLFSEPGIEVTEIGFRSRCGECTQTPFIGIRGKYRGFPFVMQLYLEPIPDSKPQEFLDTIRNEVRDIPENDDEQDD